MEKNEFREKLVKELRDSGQERLIDFIGLPAYGLDEIEIGLLLNAGAKVKSLKTRGPQE